MLESNVNIKNKTRCQLMPQTRLSRAKVKGNVARYCRIDRQRGASLIEVLVSSLVLGLGLLGILSMQSRALQHNQQAYFHSQASILAIDIVEKIRINRTVADSYKVTTGQTISSSKNCSAENCTATQLAKWDVSEWADSVSSSLPGGQVQITTSPGDADLYLVMVKFTERNMKGGNSIGQVKLEVRL